MTPVQLRAKLKRRLMVEDSSKDALLSDLLQDAADFVRDYTRLKTLPPSVDSVLVELAAIAYTRMGMEGQQSHSEGGVSVSIDGLPVMIKARLDGMRTAKVG
ncbi:MAG: phage head-tail connector protein [Clostridia bacterium]